MGRTRRRDSRTIAGLDIGSSRTCLIVGELTEEGLICRSLASLPSAGMKKGIITDPDGCGRVVGRIIDAARAESNLSVSEVYVSVPGTHIEVIDRSGSVNVRGDKVSREETDRAIASAAAVTVSDDREILHVAPCDFVLDGVPDVRDPVGMSGTSLEAKVLVLTGAIRPVRDVIACVEGAGVGITDVILQSLAAAESSLTSAERSAGVALADIGGGTTDVAIFQGGWLRYAYSIPVGGFHLTNDLSIGLGIPFDAAEGLKISRGTVLSLQQEEASTPLSRDADGLPRSPSLADITEILQPRAEELIELIDAQIRAVNQSGIPVTGLVLTGGSALFTGLDRLAEGMLGMSVRIGQPNALGTISLNGMKKPLSLSLPGEAASPAYATAVGLLLHGAAESMEMKQALSGPAVFSRILSALSGWLRKRPGGRQGRR